MLARFCWFEFQWLSKFARSFARSLALARWQSSLAKFGGRPKVLHLRKGSPANFAFGAGESLLANSRKTDRQTLREEEEN